jgi:hypothetical protein
MSESLLTLTIAEIADVSKAEQSYGQDLETSRYLSFCPPFEATPQPDVIADKESERLEAFTRQTEEPSIQVDFCGFRLQAADLIFRKRLPSILRDSPHAGSDDVITETDFDAFHHKDVIVSRVAFKYGAFIVNHQTMDYMKTTVSSSYEIRREE